MSETSYKYQYDTNPRKIKPEYKVKPEKVKNKPNNKIKAHCKRRRGRCKTYSYDNTVH